MVIRIRPPLPRELHSDKAFQNTVQTEHGDPRSVTLSENLRALREQRSLMEHGAPLPPALFATHQFTFDHVHGVESTQVRTSSRAGLWVCHTLHAPHPSALHTHVTPQWSYMRQCGFARTAGRKRAPSGVRQCEPVRWVKRRESCFFFSEPLV